MNMGAGEGWNMVLGERWRLDVQNNDSFLIFVALR